MKKVIISIGAIMLLIAVTVNVSLGINLSDDQDFGLSDLITVAHAQQAEGGCPWWNCDDESPYDYDRPETSWVPCDYYYDFYGTIEWTENKEQITCEWTVVPSSCTPYYPC